jgi:hypothetical protein
MFHNIICNSITIIERFRWNVAAEETADDESSGDDAEQYPTQEKEQTKENNNFSIFSKPAKVDLPLPLVTFVTAADGHVAVASALLEEEHHRQLIKEQIKIKANHPSSEWLWANDDDADDGDCNQDPFPCL